MERLKCIFKGIIISYVITLLLIFFFSFMLLKTNINESYINAVIIIISAVSIFIGTTISTKKIKDSGIINGILVSIIYSIIIYIISSIINKDFSVNLYSMYMIIGGIILGIIGGIIGVNIKS